MKNFALDENGDVVILNGEIEMVHGTDLILQTIESVLGTQKGEWFIDWEEGVDYKSILGKRKIEPDIVKSILQDGISQVDENLFIDKFSCNFNNSTRKLAISCTIKNNETSETLTIEKEVG